MSDLFDNISIEDKFKIETKNNIETQNFFGNDSIIFIKSYKFDPNKLSIILSDKFEIIPQLLSNKRKRNIKSKSNENEINKKNNLDKKRGRKKDKKSKNKRKKSHGRECPCNIRTKLTIAYFTFLIQFINAVIELILCDENDVNQYKLKKLNHIKNITKELIKNLKNQKIKDVISCDIDSKNFLGEKNENEEICQKIIQKSKKLEKILNQKYLEFFENIFLKNKREFNLKKYGIDKCIFLNSDVILYKDFINNIKNKENKNDNDNNNNLKQYLSLIDKGVKNYLKI